MATKAPTYRRMNLPNLNSEHSWEGLDPTASSTDILEVSKCTLQTKQFIHIKEAILIFVFVPIMTSVL